MFSEKLPSSGRPATSIYAKEWGERVVFSVNTGISVPSTVSVKYGETMMPGMVFAPFLPFSRFSSSQASRESGTYSVYAAPDTVRASVGSAPSRSKTAVVWLSAASYGVF